MDTPDLPELDRANIYFAVEHGLLDANTATLMLLKLPRTRPGAIPPEQPAEAGPLPR